MSGVGSAYMPQAQTVEWPTPKALYKELVAEFGEFDLDPASTHENALAPRHYTIEEDGLTRPWEGRVYVNPPYGKGISAWVDKALAERSRCSLIVMLLPARTDTGWFHRLWGHVDEVRFLKGRLKYGEKGCAPFPSIIVVIRGPAQ